MNIDTLIQEYFFKTLTFEIKKNCLHYKLKKTFNTIEFDIPFEEISDKIVYETKLKEVSSIIVVGLIILLTTSISSNNSGYITFSLFVIGFIIAGYIFSKDKIASLYLYDNRIITFNLKKPNSETAQQFIENLQSSIKIYLIEKYATIDRDLPLEPQLNNFTWLKNRDIITDVEFNELKKKLLKNTNENKIGFS